MNNPARTWLVVLLILAFPFALFFVFLVSQVNGPPPPPPVLPNPNGYADLIKAGQMVSAQTGNYETTDAAQLRETVSASSNGLALARAALTNECAVPLQFTRAYVTNHIQDLIAVRKLAQGFVCEGRLSEMENHFGDAAKSYLDAIRIGHASARGGVLVDEMVGVAVESLGLEQLKRLANRLDAKACRETASALETISAQQQSWPQVLRQDANWSRGTFGAGSKLMNLIYRPTRERNYQRALEKEKATEKLQNQLMMNFAARAFQLEKGNPPDSAENLVPDYLKAVPRDPFTGTNQILFAP